MKKYALNIAVASALALPFGLANASTGTIDFVGEVTDETCSLGADSIQITVPMGSYAAHHISGIPNTEARQFAINLTGCDASVALNTAEFTFSGTLAAAGNANLLALDLDGSNAATNLGIAISGTNGDFTTNLISFDGSPNAFLDTPLVDGTNTIRLYAFYKRIDGAQPVTSGSANATATFTVSYS